MKKAEQEALEMMSRALAELAEEVRMLKKDKANKWTVDDLQLVLRHAGVVGMVGDEMKVGESVVNLRRDLNELMEHLGVAFVVKPEERSIVATK